MVVKAREQRQRVLIRARMRVAASWSDVCILNISPRGLGLQTATAPPAGAYVEIRRGHHVIVARVAWSNGHRFGIQSQDVLAIPAIIAEPDPSARQAPANTVPQGAERRSAPRKPNTRFEDSRMAGQMMEFAYVAIVGIAAAMIAFSSVERALATPLAQVSAALGNEVESADD